MAVKVSANRTLETNSAGQRFDDQGNKMGLAAVLIGPKEVLVIVIVTAIVVFLAVRKKR